MREPPGSRLANAEKLIRDLIAKRKKLVPDDEDLLLRVSEAAWTIIEQYTIARSLGAPGQTLPADLTKKLTMMLSGATTEDEDRNPLARNTQFELYVRATMIMGGIPTWLAEPDLRFDYLGRETGIAAKRVRSIDRLRERAKEAVKQIKASGVPGIVAVNVDVLIKSGAPSVTNHNPLLERLAALRDLNCLLAKHEEVVASLVFARDTRWEFGEQVPFFEIAHTHEVSAYPRSERERESGDEFWRTVRQQIDERVQKL